MKPYENLAALADRSGRWIDRVHGRRPPEGVVLDMDPGVSPTQGDMAELAVPRELFVRILEMIDDLRPQPLARC
jgi:hypothetical protein